MTPEQLKELLEFLGLTETEWDDMGGAGQDFILDLLAYLQADIEGGFSPNIAKEIIDTDIDKLLGIGYDRRYSAAELPEFARVRTFIQQRAQQKAETLEQLISLEKDLPPDEQQRLAGLSLEERIQAAEAREQRKLETEAIARQQGLLPLGKGGSRAEQVWQGQRAISGLERQLSIAPDYLKPTIQQQIQELRESQQLIKETESTLARQRAGITEETVAPERLSFSTEVSGFAQKYDVPADTIAGTAIQYIGNRDAPKFANLTPEQRLDLEQVAADVMAEGSTPDLTLKPFAPPAFRDIGVSGSPSWKSWFARSYPSIADQFSGQPEEKRTDEGWNEFLEKERKRIREEFMKQSPFQRGERPGVFQPKIETFSL